MENQKWVRLDEYRIELKFRKFFYSDKVSSTGRPDK